VKVLDLFSGIGGFSLGLERAGMETIAFCEIEDYPRKVLAKHWPDIPIASDVTKLTYQDGVLFDDGKEIYRGPIDLICGGFPCQDISAAGKQKGLKEGTRSGLWSECARLLGEIRPSFSIFENVTALLSIDGGGAFQRVLWDISQIGYDAEWHCIPASQLGAHHHRDRAWIIAHTPEKRPAGQILKRDDIKSMGHFSETPLLLHSSIRNDDVPNSRNLRHDDGFSAGMGQLNTYGNAVVPQIPEIIGRAILGQYN